MVQTSEFIARGSIGELSRRIETCAAAEANAISALVVPWESGPEIVRLAVTSVRAEGWAIDHTNLGTIEVSALAADRARIVVIAEAAASDGGSPAAAALRRFAATLENLLGGTDG